MGHPLQKYAVLDKEFEEKKRDNPKLTFAQFYEDLGADQAESEGGSADVNGDLPSEDGWKKAGRSTFNAQRELTGAGPDARFVEYGCGDLSLGFHWIRYLDAGSYFGLDVAAEPMEAGKALLGEELIAEKQPRFGLLDDMEARRAAIVHGADIVCAMNVAFHTHPDEMRKLGQDLQSLAARPGCALLFNAYILNRSIRYAPCGWARPVGYYERMLPELDFVQLHDEKEVAKRGVMLTGATLEFRRPL